jgi:hypothetical protein
VVAWLAALLDSHMMGLLHSRAAAAVAARLSAAVQSEVEDMKALLLLTGAAQHLIAKAPLPSPSNAVAKLYSLELLDTRVK